MATMVGKQKDIAALLNALIELDLDAVEAYEAAIDRLDDEDDKASYRAFMVDHQRHVSELQPFVQELGEKPADRPDAKQVLTKGKVVMAGLIGDRLIHLAMKTNEDDTNTAYDRSINRDDIPSHIKGVLLRNREDERRHRDYIERRLRAYESKDEARPSERGAESVR
jgi:uncharacterized protein (TIGR02284 family)